METKNNFIFQNKLNDIQSDVTLVLLRWKDSKVKRGGYIRYKKEGNKINTSRMSIKRRKEIDNNSKTNIYGSINPERKTLKNSTLISWKSKRMKIKAIDITKVLILWIRQIELPREILVFLLLLLIESSSSNLSKNH